MKTPRSLFGQRLRAVRLRHGLTQKQLGLAAGLDEETVSARMAQYERGIHAPSFALAEQLADVMKVPAACFYARDDDLAELIRVTGRLGKKARRRLLERARACG